MIKIAIAIFALLSLSPDIKRVDMQKFKPQIVERQLWLLKVNGGKRWVCNDPNCPEHCAEILKNLKKLKKNP